MGEHQQHQGSDGTPDGMILNVPPRPDSTTQTSSRGMSKPSSRGSESSLSEINDLLLRLLGEVRDLRADLERLAHPMYVVANQSLRPILSNSQPSGSVVPFPPQEQLDLESTHDPGSH